MNNTQVLLTAAGLVVTLIVALWGIAERNTTRLVEQFERRLTENANQFDKRMNERDEKLLARIDALRAEMNGEFKAVNLRLDGLDARLSKVETQVTQLVFLEKRIEALEKRAA